MTTFNSFPLPEGLQHRLAMMHYEAPTDIQKQAIPLVLEGHDILGSAQTGTGKTGAFLIPIIAKLMEEITASAIIMTPTRELANQVHTICTQMIPKGKGGIHSALLIGGEAIGKQLMQLRRHPRIIVGTPGRVNDHLNRGTLFLDTIRFVVLDETDRMLDMGFGVQIDAILDHIETPHQTLLFSATLPKAIIKLANTYLKEPKRIAAGEVNAVAKNIVQSMKETKNKLQELRNELDNREGSVIVFVKTQHAAETLADKLNMDNYEAMAIHGGLKQNKRDMVIRKLRAGQYRILVATDVAARGLDIPHIAHVINYDLPLKPEDYIHRIGRTARGENTTGEAISLVGPAEKRLWATIQNFLRGKEEDREDPYAHKRQTAFKGHNTRGSEEKRWRNERPSGYAGRSSHGGASSRGAPREQGEKRAWSPKPTEKKYDDGEKPFWAKKKPASTFRKATEAGSSTPNATSGNKKPFGNRQPAGSFHKARSEENKPFRSSPFMKRGNRPSNRNRQSGE